MGAVRTHSEPIQSASIKTDHQYEYTWYALQGLRCHLAMRSSSLFRKATSSLISTACLWIANDRAKWVKNKTFADDIGLRLADKRSSYADFKKYRYAFLRLVT